MDRYELAQVIGGRAPDGWRWVQGTVVSVDVYGIAVTVAGGSTVVPGVRYLSPFPPLPGAGVWMISDGTDLLAVGMTAAAGRTVAPRAYRTSTMPVTSGVLTTVLFEAAENDPLGFYSFQHADHLRCQVPGRYLAVADVRWAINATGVREASVEIKGQTTVGRSRMNAVSAQTTEQIVTTQTFALEAGDEIRLLVQQTSGGSLDLDVTDAAPSLSMIYLGP